MTTLYLQRIQISNFRAYGDNFSLSLPGPGVTLLAGPPGLGKSAFFEAMEWALTGRVHRLEALSQENLDPRRRNGLLARRGEDGPVAQYSVSLEFTSGEGEGRRMERRAVREQEDRELFAEVSSPAQQQVIDLPRADEMSLERGTLLQLSAASTKLVEGLARKSTLTARADRATHELWMLQSYLRETAKAIRQITDLESRIRSLQLVAREIESCQQAYAGWVKEQERSGLTIQAAQQERQAAILSLPILEGVAWEQVPAHLEERSHRTQLEIETAQSTLNQLSNLENLNDSHAELKGRIEQLSATVKSDLGLVAQVEQEILAARALQQEHSERLSPLGDLPSSRWPALLLDEPLRTPGLIQPEVFIEVLRHLVRDRKYQVILSTHGEALADDLRRKLMPAGIPCVTCRYKGLGPTGVLTSTD